MTTSTEEVVYNEKTGARKGSKLARFDLIPTGPLTQLAEHYGRGSKKYEDRNWEKGYDWKYSYSALQRHANAFWGGEDIDEETGSPHIIAVAWHALALAEFMQTHPELDDRPAKPVPDEELKLGSVVEFIFLESEGPLLGTVNEIRDVDGPYNIRVGHSNGSEYQIGPESIRKVFS